MTELDFVGLRKELVEEFLFYAGKHDSRELDDPSMLYWRARADEYSLCVANLPGTKYLLSADDPARLSESVTKAFMLTDHVVIRHKTFEPRYGDVNFAAIPFEFKPTEWIEQHRARLATAHVVPHFRAPDNPVKVWPVVKWLTTEGRPWLEAGRVTYVPNLLPEEVDAALLAEGMNLNGALRSAQMLPDSSCAINPKVAAALAQLRVPFLRCDNPTAIVHLKEEEPEAFQRFQTHVIRLLNAISADPSSQEFSHEVEVASMGLEEATNRLVAAIEKRASAAPRRRYQIEVLALAAAVFFLIGQPVAGIMSLGAAAIDLARKLKEDLDERYLLKNEPLYILSRLGQVAEKPKRWQTSLKKGNG
jgi:hypothetical protein